MKTSIWTVKQAKKGEAHMYTLLCRQVAQKAEDLLFYSRSFDSEVTHELISLKTYYVENFKKDIETFFKNPDLDRQGMAFSLVQLAIEVERLNKIIIETFEEYVTTTLFSHFTTLFYRESKKIELLNASEMLKDTLPILFKAIRTKLSEIAKKSVGVEQSLKGVNHGTSLVDVYSAASQYFEALSNLELESEFKTLVYKSYEEIVVSVTLQYARLNETFCLETLQYMDVNSLPPELKKRAVINFNWMQKFFNEKDEAVLSEPQLIVTRDFLQKLNNIGAAREQLQNAVSEIDKEKYNYMDYSEFEMKEEEDSDNEQQEEEEGLNETSSEKKNELLEKSFMELNQIIYALIQIVVKQFQPFVRKSLVTIVNVLKDEPPQQRPEVDVIAQYDKKCLKYLDELFEQVITPNLWIFNASLVNSLFTKLLETMYSLIMQEFEELITPKMYSNALPVNASQVYILKVLLEDVINYFFTENEGGNSSSSSSSGISKTVARRESRLVKKLFKLHGKSTSNLLEYYKKKFRNPAKFEKFNSNPYILKSYQVILILQSRASYDKDAATFVNDPDQKSILNILYMRDKFGLVSNSSNNNKDSAMLMNTNEKLLYTCKCTFREKSSSEMLNHGTLYLYPSLLFIEKSALEKGAMMIMMNSNIKNVAIKLINIETYEQIEEVQRATRNMTIVQKGFKLVVSNFQETITVFIQSNTMRETFMRQFITAARLINPSIELVADNENTPKNARNSNLVRTGNLKTAAESPIVEAPAQVAPVQSIVAVAAVFAQSSGAPHVELPQGENTSVITIDSVSYNLDILAAQIRNPISGVKVRNRTYSFRSYPRCFIGQEVVDYFLARNLVKTRQAGVALGNALLKHGVFEHVVKQHLFEDKYLFYRFVKKKRVIILGGGFAGCSLALTMSKRLEKDYEVILVDKKGYFECIPSLPSIVANPSHTLKIRSNHENFLKGTTVIVAGVSKLTDTCVYLDNGQEISNFDHLVIATGSYYDLKKLKIESPQCKVVNCTSSADILNVYGSLLDAKNIVVIGSGPVGVEVAGELAVKLPTKNLHIVSSQKTFLERSCKAAHSYVEKFFKQNPSVSTYFGESVKLITGKQVHLNSGTIIDADIVFVAIGFTANTGFMSETMPGYMERGGFIKVNKFLQVLDGNNNAHYNLWAMGDVILASEEKLAQNAEKHAATIAENIDCFETGQALKEYKSAIRPMLLSLGPKNSLYITGNKVYGEGIIVSWIKNLVEYKIMSQYAA